MAFLNLPVELYLKSLFTFLDDKSLARLSCTCSHLNSLVSEYWRGRDVTVGKKILTEQQHRHLCKLGVKAVIYTDWIKQKFFVGEHCPQVTINVKLGCGKKHYPGQLSTGIEACGEYLCFHPGYRWPAGAFRGFGLPNTDMGFTPEQDVLHPWKIVIRRSGNHEVSISSGSDPTISPYTYKCPVQKRKLLPSEGSNGMCSRVCMGGSDDVKGEDVFIRVECSVDDAK